MIVIRNQDTGELREALREFPAFFLGYEPSAMGKAQGCFPVVVFLAAPFGPWIVVQLEPQSKQKKLTHKTG